MKNLKILSIYLMLTLFGVSATNAQKPVMSGSFQFISSVKKPVGTLVLTSGMQLFEFQLSENIVSAELLPGLYSLAIECEINGTVKLTQSAIEIESEKRTICRMSASGTLSFTKEYDRNSVALSAVTLRDNTSNAEVAIGIPSMSVSADVSLGMPSVSVSADVNIGGMSSVSVSSNVNVDNHHHKRNNREREVVVVQQPAQMPISDVDFNKLYNSVKNEKFADTQMQTIRTASKFSQYFTSEQVKSLALLFTHEDDKFECVKYLVPRVLDVQNLPFIKDVFKHSITKDEYLEFLDNL